MISPVSQRADMHHDTKYFVVDGSTEVRDARGLPHDWRRAPLRRPAMGDKGGNSIIAPSLGVLLGPCQFRVYGLVALHYFLCALVAFHHGSIVGSNVHIQLRIVGILRSIPVTLNLANHRIGAYGNYTGLCQARHGDL